MKVTLAMTLGIKIHTAKFGKIIQLGEESGEEFFFIKFNFRQKEALL